MLLKTEIIETDGVQQVIVTGRLDSATSSQFEQAVHNLFTTPEVRALLDLSATHYIASAGLRVILMMAKRAKQNQGQFVLCGLRPEIQEVFAISGFLKILTITEDRPAAMAKLILVTAKS